MYSKTDILNMFKTKEWLENKCYEIFNYAIKHYKVVLEDSFGEEGVELIDGDSIIISDSITCRGESQYYTLPPIPISVILNDTWKSYIDYVCGVRIEKKEEEIRKLREQNERAEFEYYQKLKEKFEK